MKNDAKIKIKPISTGRKSDVKKDEPIDFLKSYVKPHSKVARDVTKEDIPEVVESAHVLYNLCYTKTGMYPGGFAVAHPQINDTDPLRFFVTSQREIIINPVITRHTEFKVDSEEGCLSFPDKAPIMVPRWNKCEVEFVTLDTTKDSGLSDKISIQINGKMAKVFQHEIQHMDGDNIYNEK